MRKILLSTLFLYLFVSIFSVVNAGFFGNLIQRAKYNCFYGLYEVFGHGNPGTFSDDFSSWLKANGYNELLEEHVNWSSFGGLELDGTFTHRPTLFIHGNSDSALGYNSSQGELAAKFTGWTRYRDYFASKGIQLGELFGTTSGDVDKNLAAFQIHNFENIYRIRALIHAVSEYSKTRGNPDGRVNIVAHSMGNTMALKAIYGGSAIDISSSQYAAMVDSRMLSILRSKSLTLPDGEDGDISNRIDKFVGIAGASKGLDACKGLPEVLIPTCRKLMGLSPDGSIIQEVNQPQFIAAKRIYSIYGSEDQILQTSNSPERAEGVSSVLQHSSEVFLFKGEDHFEVKDEHTDLVFSLLYDNDLMRSLKNWRRQFFDETFEHQKF